MTGKSIIISTISKDRQTDGEKEKCKAETEKEGNLEREEASHMCCLGYVDNNSERVKRGRIMTAAGENMEQWDQDQSSYSLLLFSLCSFGV